MIIEKYPATVVATDIGADDGLKLGRIKVACVGLLGDEETALPMWVHPVRDWGWFYIPDVGEIVEIEVVSEGDDDEQYGQSSIDNLNITWRGLRYQTDATLEDSQNEPRPIHDDFISTAYGKRRGFATPFGHTIVFDDTDGAPCVYITLQTEKLDPPDGAPDETKITRLKLAQDGTFSVVALGAHTLKLDATEKSLTVDLDNESSVLKLDTSAMTVQIGGDSLKVEANGGDATLKLGDGAKHVPIVEALQQLWTQTKAKADAHDLHVHPTAMGPSGPPNPALQMPEWDSAINSSKLSMPDG
jgi:hypothetical protein